MTIVHPDRPIIMCTDTVLVASNLADDEIRAVIFDWLHDHGLDESLIVQSTPITRDPERREVTWHGTHCVGRQVHVTRAPSDVPVDVLWPAPFPELLLVQPVPGECPACGRAYDDEAATDA